jgi:hypothetical protein
MRINQRVAIIIIKDSISIDNFSKELLIHVISQLRLGRTLHVIFLAFKCKY